MDAPTPQEPPRRQLLADTLRKFQERGAEVNISRLLARVRPEDVAMLLADLGSTERRQVFDILSADFAEYGPAMMEAMAAKKVPNWLDTDSDDDGAELS